MATTRIGFDTPTVTVDFSAPGQAKWNVRGLAIVPTVSLPEAGVLQDGKVMIEDVGGAGTSFNLAIYAGGTLIRVAIGG